jgi:hypothetical protein
MDTACIAAPPREAETLSHTPDLRSSRRLHDQRVPAKVAGRGQG